MFENYIFGDHAELNHVLIPSVNHSLSGQEHHGGMHRTISQRINDRLAKLEPDVSAASIAKACRLSVQAVYKWLNGDTPNIRPANLIALADHLGTTPEWIAIGRGPEEARKHHDAIAPAELADVWKELLPDQQKHLLEEIYNIRDKNRAIANHLNKAFAIPNGQQFTTEVK
jgi:transcriptional regulator with XRE-family HTH domain